MKTQIKNMIIYLTVLIYLIILTTVYTLNLYEMNTGTFARFLISLTIVVWILPLIPKIKIFDLIELRREKKILRKRK